MSPCNLHKEHSIKRCGGEGKTEKMFEPLFPMIGMVADHPPMIAILDTPSPFSTNYFPPLYFNTFPPPPTIIKLFFLPHYF